MLVALYSHDAVALAACVQGCHAGDRARRRSGVHWG